MIVPAATAAFANFFVVALPAENSAMCTPSKLSSVSSRTLHLLAAELQRLAGRARGREQLELGQREIPLLEAMDQLDADGARGADDRDDWIRQLLPGSHDQCLSTNEKAPSVSGEASKIAT